ncbi:hypothetical protein AB0I53_41455 [Saccharopolyspora sp. NPDC050389]|uniref:hypothetical protein n=1 Tax=Saccharopolyspora sp. NPDC050389 TaxID=3155516 RepID=UPI0033D9C2BD
MATLVGLLEVPEGGHVSELERLRRTVTSVSGQGLKLAVDRAEEVFAFKAGEVDLSRIPSKPSWPLRHDRQGPDDPGADLGATGGHDGGHRAAPGERGGR